MIYNLSYSLTSGKFYFAENLYFPDDPSSYKYLSGDRFSIIDDDLAVFIYSDKDYPKAVQAFEKFYSLLESNGLMVDSEVVDVYRESLIDTHYIKLTDEDLSKFESLHFRALKEGDNLTALAIVETLIQITKASKNDNMVETRVYKAYKEIIKMSESPEYVRPSQMILYSYKEI